MERVDISLNNTLSFYTISTAILILLFIFAILYVCNHRGKKSDRIAIITLVAMLFAAFKLIDVGEFVTDYLSHDLVVVNGIYQNSDRSSSHSRDLGFYSVTIETDNEELHLTTAPFNSDVFLLGTYDVVAYYAPRSEILLYIEILD